MKSLAVSAAVIMGLSSPALAQSVDIWTPCLAPVASLEGVIAAFQAEGWAFPSSNDEHISNLQTASEPLLALQNLPDVQTGAGFDRHIAAAHERAEQLLIDAATLQRDGLIVAIEAYDNAGGMIRCTIAGNEFEEAAYAFDSGDETIRTIGGHEILLVPVSGMRADVTLYRLLPPADASAEARATFAATLTRHGQ